MKRILVTGGTGFLGSHLVRRLVTEGHTVVALGRPSSRWSRLSDIEGQYQRFISTTEELDSLFSSRQLDAVVHCATNYGRGQASVSEIVEANLNLPLLLLQLCARYRVNVFVNTDTCLDKRLSYYTLSKKQFVEWLELYGEHYICINAVLSHFFGPGDDPSKFATQMIRALLQGQSPIRLTPGQQKRDFIFVDDVVSALQTMLQWSWDAPRGLQSFEVGTGNSVSLQEFLNLARQLSGRPDVKLEFGALPYRSGEVMDAVAQSAPLRTLGWQPQVSLEEALARTISAERKLLAC